MTFKDLFSCAKILGLLLILISIGSCAIVVTDNRQFSTYAFFEPSLKEETLEVRCRPFVHQQRLNHNRPKPPKVDPSTLSEDEFDEILMSYAEAMTRYVDDEEKYLNEDIVRHRETCK
jgi:hypothetical protein